MHKSFVISTEFGRIFFTPFNEKVMIPILKERRRLAMAKAMDFPRGDAIGKFHQWALFTERELTTQRKSYLDHN
jgi:hypothetical protein